MTLVHSINARINRHRIIPVQDYGKTTPVIFSLCLLVGAIGIAAAVASRKAAATSP
ncbi:hypothetical protein ACSFBF_29145 [Variovorax sp. ZT5P49]|uniref:hypothetical protein n=1 Tax=Variovorax sp. ZT5P49 TaxID=3443733 RepID=UPI003F47413A